ARATRSRSQRRPQLVSAGGARVAAARAPRARRARARARRGKLNGRRSSPGARAAATARARTRKGPAPLRRSSSAAEEDLEHARRVLSVEAAALRRTAQRLDASFARAVDLVAGCRGKVVVTGMGKSGQICRKIASTLASTGTPAFFLHAVEG